MKNKRIAVVGLGQFGSSLVRDLAHRKVEVLAIDKDPRKIQDVSEYCDDAVTLDILDEEAVRDHLEGVEVLVVCIGETPLPGILLTTIAKDLGIQEIFVRSHGETASNILEKLGATERFSPEQKAAEHMALRLTVPNSVDSVPLAADQAIVKVSVPEAWVGRSIADIGIRQNHAVNIICVCREGESVADFSPALEKPFEATDQVYLLGSKDRLEQLDGPS